MVKCQVFRSWLDNQTFHSQTDSYYLKSDIRIPKVVTRLVAMTPLKCVLCLTQKKVLEEIIRRGRIGRRLLRYLREAISLPCGLDNVDYTICCEGNRQVQNVHQSIHPPHPSFRPRPPPSSKDDVDFPIK